MSYIRDLKRKLRFKLMKLEAAKFGAYVRAFRLIRNKILDDSTLTTNPAREHNSKPRTRRLAPRPPKILGTAISVTVHSIAHNTDGNEHISWSIKCTVTVMPPRSYSAVSHA
jgi:hypothetical protein